MSGEPCWQMPNEKVTVWININKTKHCSLQEIKKTKYIKYNNYNNLKNLKTYKKKYEKNELTPDK